MFGVSLPELIVVLLIALLIFGPDKLPELARSIGKLSGQFRRQSDSLRREFYNSVYKPADDIRSTISKEARSLMSEPVAPRVSLEKNEEPPSGELKSIDKDAALTTQDKGGPEK